MLEAIWNAFFYAVIAGVLGVVISLTYMKTGKVSKNFARTLIILPILVCVVITMVNGNLGTSVAIVGAFSLIRFRSLQGSSRDIAFIFFAMTAGLTCSMGYLLFAVAVTVLVCVILFVLQLVHYGEKKTEEKDLRITIPENLDYTNIFNEIFEHYTKGYKLLQVKTTNMGSLYELRYHTTLKDEAQEKEFLDALRVRNGNLTVILGRTDMEEEEL
ncbi:DUF4956 domain-containing protein [Roseburia sp. 499]|uniref:DUF4956 domain-containing protein n=1 Tax=Roseburia sp. 499 TaxID=1261634 RepID=UPI000951F749|nr:DUF4956 domain-containing protein [Roseburia sp. 499]WVK71128.1 DUF4956 domain-containing protein [Roseburia sp. 499]